MTDLSLPEFAKSLYARFGVREACLYLQDEAGCDVILVLTAAWLGAQGRRLELPEWRALERKVAPWRESVVEPLRSVRRHLKGQSGDPSVRRLRERIKGAEVEAELHSLQWLEVRLEGMGRSGKRESALHDNLRAIAKTEVTVLVRNVIWAGILELQEYCGH